MNNKKEYKELCLTESAIPIFSRDWWLDAVCGEENWDVILVESGDRIVASMPLYFRRVMGMKIITMPKLTQKLGPWIRPLDAKYPRQLAYQKKVMDSLIARIPKNSYFLQSWDYAYTNWLPFYWHGYRQTTNYTYVLNDIKDEQRTFDGFQENIRRNIRKAANRFSLKVRPDATLDDFYQLMEKTYERQKEDIPVSRELLSRIDSACRERGCGKIWVASDPGGKDHAGIYIVWDENSAYYLAGGSDPALRSSGANSLLLWEAIRHAASVTEVFDFEGSMSQPIERFFRAFGAVQMPYFCINRIDSRLLQMRQFIKDR